MAEDSKAAKRERVMRAFESALKERERLEAEEQKREQDPDSSSERARKAFAAMLDNIELEDLFGELIIDPSRHGEMVVPPSTGRPGLVLPGTRGPGKVMPGTAGPGKASAAGILGLTDEEGDMEERVKALEDKVGQMREDIASIKSTLAQVATKADMHELKAAIEARMSDLSHKLIMWAVGTLIAGIGVSSAIVFNVVRQAGPPTINVTIPPQISAPAAPVPKRP